MSSRDLLEVSDDGATLVAHWKGDIDMSNNKIVERATLDVIANAHSTVIIDLSDVTYLDSAGIHSLVTLKRALEERQQRLVLVVPETSLLRRALEIGGVVAAIPTFRSLATARPNAS